MDDYYKERKKQMWRGCGKIEHAGKNVKCTATMENSLIVPQKVKDRITR